MSGLFLTGLQTFNELLAAGVGITAFSLLLYALTFNLRDRVARSFAVILACVVIVFGSDSIGSTVNTTEEIQFWLQFQWIGIIFLPTAYLHFSDALLSTTGQPSRSRRRLLIRLAYILSICFLLALPVSGLVGPLAPDAQPVPRLERTTLTWVFTVFYVASMVLALFNLLRAYRRTLTRTSRRRMTYLLAGASAPALGSFPYLLFGAEIAQAYPLLFWVIVTLNNLAVSVLIVLMAYAVAFFGVSWSDRVVKRRLFKWLMRGPITASVVLALTTLVRRLGEQFGSSYIAAVPVVMVATLLLMEYMITLAAPYWEGWLFYGGDRSEILQLQNLEERLLTLGDLKQFMESILAAVCDRLQVSQAFIAALGGEGLEILMTIGRKVVESEMNGEILRVVEIDAPKKLFLWGDFWLVPLYEQRENNGQLLGLMGFRSDTGQSLEDEHLDALEILSYRAALALEDRIRQQKLFSSLQDLTPGVEIIQNLRAAARYNGVGILSTPTASLESDKLTSWVKDALTHYWGGPKLTESPLIGLRVVQATLAEHQDNPANALRAILRQAIEQVKPEGERRFTGEWILYNILEMKFMEGRKVREVALRLAMSEADLYRKQRVAIESVTNKILEMEAQARNEQVGEGERITDRG